MRVMLINPPMDVNVALGRADSIAKYTIMIPHGLASIAAVLLKNGVQCSIIDAYAKNLSINEVVKELISYSPDVVGISCVTPVMPIVNTLVRQIKEKNSAICIVLGGPHPSILPEETLEDYNIDILVRGEGELTFLKLLRCLSGSRNFNEIDGISYRSGGRIVHNKAVELIEDLDSLPQAAYSLLPMHLYTAPPQWSIASPSYQVMASRGCPFKCSFCYVGMGKHVRYKSAQYVCNEIEYLIENYGCRQAVFVDTTFPFNNKHVQEVCSEIIKRKLNKKIVWFTSTRVDIINKEMLSLMYDAGCRLITLGVESGDQDMLDSMKKNITLDQVIKAVKLAHKAKINVTASFVLGLPGETRQTILNTIKFAKKLNTLYAQFNIIVPYPGTEVYDYAVKNGLLRNKDWSNYVSLTSMTNLDPPFIPEGMSKAELFSLQRKAYNSYYLRPAVIAKHLKKLIINREFKKYFSLLGILLKTFKK